MSTLKLESLPGYRPFPGPVVFVVMDGVGLGRRDESDGVFLANTPELDALLTEPLFTKLRAHGTAVGLPSDEDMGNSEVGHNALGAGRVFAQGAKLVNAAIESGEIFRGAAWRAVMARAQAGGTVHFIGLLSDGNVHSHIRHLFAMLDRAAAEGVRRVRVHVLLDGRDVGEKSALTYLESLEGELARLNASGGRDYRIASGGGRMVTTMDRYNADWRVVERGWQAHVLGVGRAFASAREAVETYYREDATATLCRDDAVRRRREDPVQVPRRAAGDRPDDLAVPVRGGRDLVRGVGDAEVRPRHLLLERQQLGLRGRAAGDLRRGSVRHGHVRPAPVDEVGGDHRRGHRGNVPAIRVAVESVDLGLQRIAPAVRAAGGVLVATADHGNADCMFTVKNGKREAMVAHTLNPVPFVVKDFSGANRWSLAAVASPGLSNVAATLLALLGYRKPDEYDPALLELN